MASIALGAAGAALGGSIPVIGSVVGSSLGRTLGGALGGAIDTAIFGSNTRRIEGARLEDLSVQVSTYGKDIPSIYGTIRLAGNVIWSQPIKEIRTTSTSRSGGGKGVSGGGTKTSTTSYSYTVSLAIALCEGEIERVERIWADAKLLDVSLGTYRTHTGSEDQLPDSFIEAIEGVGNAPAYRGLAYIVVEDFPLEAFGNRIPNFTFEVKKPAKSVDYEGVSTEDMIEGMTLIPGAGEFVYDTVEQVKKQGEYIGIGFAQSEFTTSINRHTPNDATNAIVSLDQLEATCPNTKWASVVVTWFGDAMDAGDCVIMPGVEFQDDAITQPDSWQVAGYARDTARQITLDGFTPRYGGTPSDASLVRYVSELKRRGYHVMLYPMFFMDVEQKPWRGRVTGSPANISSFFTKSQGFNEFVMHYAGMMKDQVDAFVIGSELIGLTSVSDGAGNYPAVNALVDLAAAVKTTMGQGTKVTYAADWSEYHHTVGGWYNLDPLWASPHIDMIGIDAYFPLSNTSQSQRGYSVQDVIDGWDSGEGYDFVFTNAQRTTQEAISLEYAWKNIEWFWGNAHVNPDGSTTAWQPQSKPVWFTEYGFPSVDGATNQPNVFYDPQSIESFFPRMSNGTVDFAAQRQGITATLARWKDSAIVENLFLWTWDARPFPYFPDLRDVWADGGVWATGHWVTGKFGVSALAAIVKDLCLKAGLEEGHIDVTLLSQRVDGYVLNRQSSARYFLEELMAAYFFDAVESGTTLKFIPRGHNAPYAISEDMLVRKDSNAAQEPLLITRQEEVALPARIDVLYLDRARQYQTGMQHATRETTDSLTSVKMAFPLVLPSAEANAMAQKQLFVQWMERTSYQFSLSNHFAAIEPGDIISLRDTNGDYTMRITRTLRDLGKVDIEAVAEDTTLYQQMPAQTDDAPLATAIALVPQTTAHYLDMPALPNDAADALNMRVACVGDTELWRGAAIFQEDGQRDYQRIADVEQGATLGKAINALAPYSTNDFDALNTVTVRIMAGEQLQNVTELALLNGANLALLGGEMLQFQYAQPLGASTYRLSHLLRGRLGTESFTSTHTAGDVFVLLDEAVTSVAMNVVTLGLMRDYKAVTYGATLGSVNSESFAYRARCLQPYAPVHVQFLREDNDIIVSWIRRDRLYGAWRDFVDIGNSERSERYSVVIYSTNGQVLREVITSEPYYRYSFAQQQEDNGLVQVSQCRVAIAQLSEIVGKGDVVIADSAF